MRVYVCECVCVCTCIHDIIIIIINYYVPSAKSHISALHFVYLNLVSDDEKENNVDGDNE